MTRNIGSTSPKVLALAVAVTHLMPGKEAAPVHTLCVIQPVLHSAAGPCRSSGNDRLACLSCNFMVKTLSSHAALLAASLSVLLS